ncbi:MAG: glutathione peroxidase [Zoogloeaceae bacterium]|nr:glutathione peroxidase [Zoogloeaceae bacterium]
MGGKAIGRHWGALRASVFGLAIALLGTGGGAQAGEGACPALLNHRFPKLQDESGQDLCQYRGKVVMVVNTASFCGFTRQYEGLERIYDRYRERGLVVLGFPSNEFGKQEPGSNQEIAEFCRATYGVKFPMFAKAVVTGREANGLYQQLGRVTGATPQWNFHKYLIDRSGEKVLSFPSEVAPESRIIVTAVERMLAEP